uniref:Uncharacterized protein n=1 Tax=Arundo donax TaxID=35708 RepID=A0A0A9GNX3_ARUDO
MLQFCSVLSTTENPNRTTLNRIPFNSIHHHHGHAVGWDGIWPLHPSCTITTPIPITTTNQQRADSSMLASYLVMIFIKLSQCERL